MRMYDKGSKKNASNFIVVGDKKTPKNLIITLNLLIIKKIMIFRFLKNVINTYARKILVTYKQSRIIQR